MILNVLTKEKSPPGLMSESGSPLGLAGAIPSSGEDNCTTDCDILQGTRCTEKFSLKRQKALYLADVYEGLGLESKSLRVRSCGSFLSFAQNIGSDLQLGKPRLLYANFCRERLCPMCAWRRSLKLFQNLEKIINVTGTDYSYILLTLTVRNCSGADLRETIDSLMKAQKTLFSYAEVRRIALGWNRTLEVTRNRRSGEYHPHLHYLIAVPRSYATNHSSPVYITQKRWRELWQRAMKLDYDPQIRVSLVKDFHGEVIAQGDDSRLVGAVKEVAKYTVKDSDYIMPENWQLSAEIIQTLDSALKGRRLHALGGVFKDVAQALKLQDPESDGADLTDCDRLNPLGDWLVTRFSWRATGYSEIDCDVLDYNTRQKLKERKLH